jgi:hypothetical protein
MGSHSLDAGRRRTVQTKSKRFYTNRVNKYFYRYLLALQMGSHSLERDGYMAPSNDVLASSMAYYTQKAKYFKRIVSTC